MDEMPISEYMLGLVSTPTFEEAQKIAHALVEKKLAACCTIQRGATSVYKWEGKIEEAEECLLFIKTRQNVFSELIDEVRKMHSYNVPEIIGVPIMEGFIGYLGWVDECTRVPGNQISI